MGQRVMLNAVKKLEARLRAHQRQHTDTPLTVFILPDNGRDPRGPGTFWSRPNCVMIVTGEDDPEGEQALKDPEEMR